MKAQLYKPKYAAENLDDACDFWDKLYDMHLYPTKGEAMFKTLVIAISWVGGIHVHETVGADALYLYSIAIIMEYAVQLTRNDTVFRQKILPGTLVIINSITAIIATGELLGKAPTDVFRDWLIATTLISLAIIAIDTIIMIFAKTPSKIIFLEAQLNELSEKR